jgi:hypothetical protein
MKTVGVMIEMKPISHLQLNGQIALVLLCIIGNLCTGAIMIAQNFTESDLSDILNISNFGLTASWILTLFFQRELFKHHRIIKIMFGIWLANEMSNLLIYCLQVGSPRLFGENNTLNILKTLSAMFLFILSFVTYILLLKKKYRNETRVRLFRTYIFWFLGANIALVGTAMILGFLSYFMDDMTQYFGIIYLFIVISQIVLLWYYSILKKIDPNEIVDTTESETNWPPPSQL